MKIIEGMKRVKINKVKITDLQNKIGQVSAHISVETPLYGDETRDLVRGWIQTCQDLTQDNVTLLTAIAKTNLATAVTIQLGGKSVSKSIAEWIWRRREYAAIDLATWSKLTDRNLKEGQIATSTGVPIDAKIIRNFDPKVRDEMMGVFKSEPGEIDSALEVVNAVTDLLEG